jgi:hypothetical protein
MRRELYGSNLNCSTFLFNFSALPPLCYLCLFLPSSVSSLISIMVSRLLPLSIQSMMQQKKPLKEKMVEASQRERSIEGKKKDQMHEGT